LFIFPAAPITKEAASVGTHATFVTSHESLDCCPETAGNQTPICNVPPIVEESRASIDSAAARQESELSLHSLNLEIEGTPSDKSKRNRHKRSATNELLMEYLQNEGSTENRAMVRIESSILIEDVYDGVHDGEVLGVGVTGSVRLITRKDTGVQRAVKRLDLSNLKCKADLETLLSEIKIMWYVQRSL
jgi:hypothetical protein